MSRSKWKGPTLFNGQTPTSHPSRHSEILPNFLGSTVYVYNGKNYKELKITNDMLGHKFGEFSFTRAKFAFKKKKNKKKKK